MKYFTGVLVMTASVLASLRFADVAGISSAAVSIFASLAVVSYVISSWLKE